MSAFDKRELPEPKRVCLRLKESREAKKIPITEVARRTRISQKYLLALEECRFQDIPFGATYQKHFVKSYTEALGLPSGPFLEQFIAEETPLAREPLGPTARQGGRPLYNLPVFLRSLVTVASVAALLGYLGYQINVRLKPPALSISSPANGFIAKEQALLVRGATERETLVTINGQDIAADAEGNFHAQIFLSPGINTIAIAARRKHGKAATDTRHVIFKGEIASANEKSSPLGTADKSLPISKN